MVLFLEKVVLVRKKWSWLEKSGHFLEKTGLDVPCFTDDLFSMGSGESGASLPDPGEGNEQGASGTQGRDRRRTTRAAEKADAGHSTARPPWPTCPRPPPAWC